MTTTFTASPDKMTMSTARFLGLGMGCFFQRPGMMSGNVSRTCIVASLISIMKREFGEGLKNA